MRSTLTAFRQILYVKYETMRTYMDKPRYVFRLSRATERMGGHPKINRWLSRNTRSSLGVPFGLQVSFSVSPILFWW